VRHATLPKRGGRLRGAWSDCRSAPRPVRIMHAIPSLARRCPALDAQACASTRACEASRLLQLEADCATYACAAELCRSDQLRLSRAPTAHGWSGDSHFALLARPRCRQANFPGRRALLQLATQRAPDSRRWRPGHLQAGWHGRGRWWRYRVRKPRPQDAAGRRASAGCLPWYSPWQRPQGVAEQGARTWRRQLCALKRRRAGQPRRCALKQRSALESTAAPWPAGPLLVVCGPRCRLARWRASPAWPLLWSRVLPNAWHARRGLLPTQPLSAGLDRRQNKCSARHGMCISLPPNVLTQRPPRRRRRIVTGRRGLWRRRRQEQPIPGRGGCGQLLPCGCLHREVPCWSAITWKQWRLEAPASEARSARPVGQATVQQHAAWHRWVWPSRRPGVASLARSRGARGRNSA